MLLELSHISHAYKKGREVLHDINLTIDKGEMIAIMGPSGSGKTTLLNILCGQLIPTAGTVALEDTSLSMLSENQRAKLRKDKLAYIYQDYHLLDSLTNKENIMLGLSESLTNRQVIDRNIEALAVSLGIKEIIDHYPSECSGGQKQRVAIARALAQKPGLLLADEPTGNLDSRQTRLVMEQLSQLNETGLTILIVTHDLYVASYASRLIYLQDGVLSTSPEIEEERLSLRERRLQAC